MSHLFRSGPAVGALLAVVLAAAPDVRQADAEGDPNVPVIVQYSVGGLGAARAAVAELDGRVGRPLPIVDGFAASVPSSALGALAAAGGVRAVAPDATVHVHGGLANASDTPAPADDTAALAGTLRADEVWATGNHGRGVTVAVADTGITQVDDLAGRIRPVQVSTWGATAACLNLSGEPDCTDTYGHGTFVAGVIAGNGASSSGRWAGVAPAADLVSIKLAGRDGSTDVSNVLAAIQWVVSHKDTYGIRVLNLSVGTDSTQSYLTDPLNYAVERAWDAGVVVVVSASNLGPDPGSISKPGDDPLVVTVGAVDDRGTPELTDDVLPDFSARGPTAGDGLAKPDVVAPGARVMSLRSPGSTIDRAWPGTSAYLRGSGTSFSAAAVSGAVALMLSRTPRMTPDAVKYAMLGTARAAASRDAGAVGAGVVDAYAATVAPPQGRANAGVERSNGTGLIDLSRGRVSVSTTVGQQTVVSGQLTAQLLAWDPVGYLAPWTPVRWYVSTWAISPWMPLTWAGSDWPGHNWGGDTWGGATFYGEPVNGSYGMPATQAAAWYGAWG
jgi:serine protease AprX